METSATDVNGITTKSNVRRIQIELPDDIRSRKIEVYCERVEIAPNSRQISKRWENAPLLLDLADSKIVQALALIKEVVEAAEWQRIIRSHNPASTPTTVPTNLPIPGVLTPNPAPSPTPAAVPTPTPPTDRPKNS